jgi:hypothetical protein
MLAGRYIDGQTYLGINHEAEDVLNTVKGEDTSISAFPETLVVGASTLDGCSELVDVLGVGDCDFEICDLLITLETVQVLAVDYLDRVDGRLVLGEVSLEVSFERLAIVPVEGCRGSYVEIVHEVGDV